MTHHEDWLRPADAAILSYLSEERADYVPLIAGHRGLNLDYAERRVETLAADGLVEPVSREVVYRITDRGERALEIYRTTEADYRTTRADTGSVEPTGTADSSGGADPTEAAAETDPAEAAAETDRIDSETARLESRH